MPRRLTSLIAAALLTVALALPVGAAAPSTTATATLPPGCTVVENTIQCVTTVGTLVINCGTQEAFLNGVPVPVRKSLIAQLCAQAGL